MYPITLTKKIEDIELCGKKLGELNAPDLEYPWELIKWFHENIKSITEPFKSDLDLFKEGVYTGSKVDVSEYVFFDTRQGSVFIDDNAVIGPFSYIEGPCYIGKNVALLSHSQVRRNSSIGHKCKIGGEVGGSIFQPYSNKAHHGYIGDSYIGSWVNIGAGTSCSNLKNTYGPVRVEYQGEKIDTGMQFFGCILGDYVKSSINSSIYTGKIAGIFAQLFGCMDKNVGSFVMDSRDGPKVFDVEASIRMQKRMFKRRGIDQTGDDIAMISALFEQTENERLAL